VPRPRSTAARCILNSSGVPLSRIAPALQRAVVAAEDASFFAHEGFDWEGIKDAALYNLEVGEFKRGGSTITQQLAKNLYLSSERSLLRKGSRGPHHPFPGTSFDEGNGFWNCI
jgi:membrane peptidoglycan carboxypeptidase